MKEDLQASDPKDIKIINLARASLARSQAREAACVRRYRRADVRGCER